MIPVTVVISLDMSGKVAAQNRALVKEGKYPMSDEQILSYTEGTLKCSIGDLNFKLEHVAIARDTNHKYAGVLPVLRQSLGLYETDASKDTVLAQYTSTQALRACCKHYTQSEDWADAFVRMAKSCGYLVTTLDEKDTIA